MAATPKNMKWKYQIKPGKNGEGAANIAVGDCLEVMRNRLVSTDTVDCAVCDPPFNMSQAYDPRNAKADNKKWDDFAEFTHEWIGAVAGCLRPGGAMFVHCGDHFADFVRMEMKKAGLIPINWIIWTYNFGQYQDSAFIHSHEHLHYFIAPESKTSKRTWNPTEVMEPSQRLLTGDKRVKTAKYKGMQVFKDTWFGDGLCRIQGNNEERTKHPNQLPELYCSRMLRATTNPGDRVFDPFLGSGTTAVVARALKRNFVGCEIVPSVAESAYKRILKGPVRDVAGSLVSDPTSTEK